MITIVSAIYLYTKVSIIRCLHAIQIHNIKLISTSTILLSTYIIKAKARDITLYPLLRKFRPRNLDLLPKQALKALTCIYTGSHSSPLVLKFNKNFKGKFLINKTIHSESIHCKASVKSN